MGELWSAFLRDLSGPEFPWLWFLLIAYVIATAWVLWRLYSRPASLAKKLLWTPVVCVPLLGWIFFGGFFKLPSPLPRGLRTPVNRYAVRHFSARRQLDRDHGVPRSQHDVTSD